MKNETAKHLTSSRLGEIYSRTAAFYDQVVAEHQAAAKLLALTLLDRAPGEPFLEVAFGTGWAFEHLIARSGHIRAYGVEIAGGMVEVARARLGPEASLVRGDSSALPFRDDTFSCLLCTYTLECLPEPAILQSLKEMLRVLAPGGRAVLADLTDGVGDDATMTDDWKHGYARDPEFYGGARPIRLEPYLQEAGLSIRERHYSGHGSGWPSEVVLAVKDRA